MGALVGIDLGTTYSVVAYVTPDGRPEVIPNEFGQRITPSVVYFGESGAVVGDEAKERQSQGAAEVASFFKREMGNPYFLLSFQGRDYTTVDLSALVLGYMKAQAERALGQPVTHCEALLHPPMNFCSACGRQQSGYAASTETGFLAPDHMLKQRYRILRRLGEGGMGAVYQAEDLLLHDKRAVKEMRRSGLSSEFLRDAARAFRQEAALLERLNHPQVPHRHDFFEEAGRLYLVMDFIVGETLEARLDQAAEHKLPLEQVLDIGIKLCTVLSYLHTCKPPIIFRDLKPGNVMLTPEEKLYLIDFGAARLFKPGQTRDTVLLGSHGYAAPEQYGRAQTTASTDIYGLGATLHQMLSGNDPPRPPQPFPPLELGTQEYASALERLVMRMVDKDVEQRPASMEEVKQELQHLLGLLPPTGVVARPRSQPPGTVLATCQGHAVAVYSAAWSPDGARLASVGADRTARVWDAASGGSLITCQGHTQRVYGVGWSPDGKRLASASGDRTVRVWDAASGGPLVTCQGHTQRVYGVAWSPDGTRLASVGLDRTVRVWEAASGALVATCQGHSEAVSGVGWSPDGTRLASASGDRTVRVWEVASRKLLLTCQEHTAGVNAVAWSPDGTRLASASGDRTVRVWDAASGALLSTCAGHTGSVLDVAWSPDGSRLASSGEDETARVWKASNGRLLFTFREHHEIVHCAGWSPDGRRIVSGGGDALVLVWLA
jgi:tRNA A-37 threonylcarbamoyl transferase component Bud32